MKKGEEYLLVRGGKKLEGEIFISGAKNATLPIMAASLLTDEELILKNVPDLKDVSNLKKLILNHGAEVSSKKSDFDSLEFKIKATKITNTEANYELVNTMRASILLLGPLLSRMKKAKISLPGGCAIGARPVGLHLKALEELGANIKIEEGYIVAAAKNGLKGCEIEFPIVSVGATENILMAATLAKGVTILRRSAREPEIVDLANCLISMGAKISGAGTDVITITGVEKLHSTTHSIMSDRIEAGSFLCAAAITKGHLLLKNIESDFLEKPIDILKRAGAIINVFENSIEIKAGELNAVDIITAPYPSFPTDLQAQFMALFSVSKGSSKIIENIFENRFMHVNELIRLGANIDVNGKEATIKGVDSLNGAEVTSTDLRASISLVIAGLYAKGDTKINSLEHLDRGYANLEKKLSKVGADLKRVKD